MRTCTFIIILLAVVMSMSRASAQDTLQTKGGVVILNNGEIIFGTTTEITPEFIKYIRTDNNTLYTVKRSDVYAIVYPNQTKEIITPVPGQSQDDLMKARTKKDTLKYYLSHGLVRVGVGFVENHGSINTSGYETTASPGFILGYVARINSSILVGVQLEFNKFVYTSSKFNDYSQTQIDRKVTDKIVAPGFYARYNLMNGFIKPYLTGGFSVNIYKLETQSTVLFLDNNRAVDTEGTIHGVQFALLLRAGLDLNLSRKFGAYADVGFGTNLVQLGVFFNLQ